MGQATISRWNNSGALALTDRLREAVTAYWGEHGITVDAGDAPPDAAGALDAIDAPSEPGESTGRRERGETRETGSEAKPSRARDQTASSVAPVEEPVRSPIPLSVLPPGGACIFGT